MSTTTSASSAEEATIKYVCGIDIGSQSCAGCICRPDKSVVVKPMTTALAKEGWQVLVEKLTQLDAAPGQILIGMEATSRDAGESLSGAGTAWVCTVFVASRANASVSPATRLACQDGSARCDDDRPGALPRGGTSWLHPKPSGSPRIANWCAYTPSSPMRQRAIQNEIQALVVVLFPEFTQVFADPCLPSALSVRNRLSACPGGRRGRCRGDLPGVTGPDACALWSPHRKARS